MIRDDCFLRNQETSPPGDQSGGVMYPNHCGYYVEGCAVVQGIDMLIAQGVEQFERWTGRRAPPAMEAAVRAMPE